MPMKHIKKITILITFLQIILFSNDVLARRRKKRYKIKTARHRRISKSVIRKKQAINSKQDITSLLNEINTLKRQVFQAKSNLIISSINNKFKRPLVPIIKVSFTPKLSDFVIDGILVSIDGHDVISSHGYSENTTIEENYETLEGKHILYVRVALRGRGLGVFNYLSNYTVIKELKQELKLPQRDNYLLDIKLSEKNAFFNSFNNRPYIEAALSTKSSNLVKRR